MVRVGKGLKDQSSSNPLPQGQVWKLMYMGFPQPCVCIRMSPVSLLTRKHHELQLLVKRWLQDRGISAHLREAGPISNLLPSLDIPILNAALQGSFAHLINDRMRIKASI